MTINIEKYLNQGEQRRWSKQDEAYDNSPGSLRGGSVGCILSSGNVSGHCHRLSALSHLGCTTLVPDDSLRRLFDGGHWNETTWADNLAASDLRADGYDFLREEEAQLRWTVPHPTDGEPVEASGRPDLLIIKPGDDYVPPMTLSSGEIIPARNYTPIQGFELKKISSAWRTNKVHWLGDPSNDYLIQAANYSLRLGKIPWTLSFSNHDNFDFYYSYVKQGAPKKIGPTRKHFEVTWEGDKVLVDGRPTTITGAGIDAYYQLILEMVAAKNLGPRPSYASVLPGMKDQFNSCTNCIFAESCDQYDKDQNYEDFVATARHLTKGE